LRITVNIQNYIYEKLTSVLRVFSVSPESSTYLLCMYKPTINIHENLMLTSFYMQFKLSPSSWGCLRKKC